MPVAVRKGNKMLSDEVIRKNWSLFVADNKASKSSQATESGKKAGATGVGALNLPTAGSKPSGTATPTLGQANPPTTPPPLENMNSRFARLLNASKGIRPHPMSDADS